MLVKGGGNFASGVNVHTIFAVLCHFAKENDRIANFIGREVATTPPFAA
jgi:hypothetical protein